MQVFLDLDGVCSNFDLGCTKIFQIPRTPRKPLQDTPDYLGISKTQFWKILDSYVIDSYGESWWANLEPEPWAWDLIEIVEKYDKNWKFLTSPSRSHYAASGKVLWMQKHFGKNFNRYHITPARNKRDLAGFGRVLIDDNDKNCQEFQASGGNSILFPRLWNSSHELEDSKLEIVQSKLEFLSKTF